MKKLLIFFLPVVLVFMYFGFSINASAEFTVNKLEIKAGNLKGQVSLSMI